MQTKIEDMTPDEHREYAKHHYNYTIAWMKVMSIIEKAKTNPIIVQWNHHQWTFTDEKEAWLFAAYWNLL